MTEGSGHSPLATVRIVLWVLVALAALGLGVLLFSSGGRDQGTGDIQSSSDFSSSIGGPFTLTAADGSRFTDADLKGMPTALFFGFTRCPDVCPTTLARLAKLKRQLGTEGDGLRIVFVSVDPGHDNPQDVGRYVSLFDTPIVGLTGTDAQVADVAKAFQIHVEKVPQEGGDYTVDHTATTFLLDRDGRLQATIAVSEPDSMALAKLRRVAAS